MSRTTLVTLEVNGAIRYAASIPPGALKVDFTKTQEQSIPIVIVGDSSRSWHLTATDLLLEDAKYRGPYVLDLLLINGSSSTCRFFEVSTETPWTEKDKIKPLRNVPREIERRANYIQWDLRNKADINVLNEDDWDAIWPDCANNGKVE